MSQRAQPRPIRFLAISFANEYGQKKAFASVYYELGDELNRESAWHTSRPKGTFSGENLEDFRAACYVGHGHDSSGLYADEQDSLWGWGHEFKPFTVDSVSKAERIYKTLRTIERANERISYKLGLGWPQTFDMYLRRLAAIVGATEIRFWMPREGITQQYLSEGYQLAEGADLAVAIAQAWGRSSDAGCSAGLIADVINPPMPAEPTPPSPLRLGRDDVLRCVVCGESGLDHGNGEEWHSDVSPRCYDPETIAQAEVRRAS